MQIEPCPFCGAEAQPRYDYFSGSSMKHHFIVCTKDANHRGGVGCYNTAPGQGNPSDSVGSCYKCQQDQTPCHFSIAAWNQRAERPSPAASEVERAVMVCPQCEGEGGYPDGMDEAACHTECTRCGSNGWIVNQAAIAAMRPASGVFSIGERVTKIKGSAWTGRVVGTYSTALTPEGYAVESENELGSVQIYPAAALRQAGEG